VAFDCNSARRGGQQQHGAVNFRAYEWLVRQGWFKLTSALLCGVEWHGAQQPDVEICVGRGNSTNFDAQGGKGDQYDLPNKFIRGSGEDAMAINASEGQRAHADETTSSVSNTSIWHMRGRESSLLRRETDPSPTICIMDSPRYAGVASRFFSQNRSQHQ